MSPQNKTDQESRRSRGGARPERGDPTLVAFFRTPCGSAAENAAAGALYQTIFRLARPYALRLLAADPLAAEEVAERAAVKDFTALWTAKRGGRALASGGLAAYTRRSVEWEGRRWLQRYPRVPRVSLDTAADGWETLLEQILDDGPTPEEVLLAGEERRERQARLQALFAVLEASPPLHRAALLYALEPEEIAALQGCVEPYRVAAALGLTEAEWRAMQGRLPLSDAAIAQQTGQGERGAEKVRFARHKAREKLLRHGFWG